MLTDEYTDRVYAGVLGKLIGVYLGRPVEGWPYQDIASRFGVVDRYVSAELGVPLVVADDDISGTLAFARVVEDNPGRRVTAADVGDTWLNYIIEDRTILWWGGYGRSTEHTAFLNLKHGIAAPRSGAIAQNGRTLAEQIGAQIFSDAFALMHPGDPEAAAELTRRAGSVSHDGAALECAAFFAAMRAQAFADSDLGSLIETATGFVTDPRLLALIEAVACEVDETKDWRQVREWVDQQYGYRHYPGPCHALSNTAMSLASLLVGGDDFRTAVSVAASVGFDTDSNAGTVGCLNGVRLGLAAFERVDDLRAPVADRAIVVSSDGGESITDAARETRRIVASHRTLHDLPALPRAPRFDFVLSGSVHGFQSCPYRADRAQREPLNLNARGGANALAVHVDAERGASVSTGTFLDPRETMSNFSTLASPTLYPTHVVEALLAADAPCGVRSYALYRDGDEIRLERSNVETLSPEPRMLVWEVPAVGNLVPFRIGFEFESSVGEGVDARIYAVDWQGAPRDFRQTGILLTSIWDTKPHTLDLWVSSARNFEADFAGTYSVSHPEDCGLVTTGTRQWQDYSIRSTLTFSLHEAAGLVVRARGHRRFLAAVFAGDRVQLVQQTDAQRRTLAEASFDYALDTRYDIELSCNGGVLELLVDGRRVLRGVTDQTGGGGAGFLIERGTVTADGLAVQQSSLHRALDRKAPQ